MQKRTKILSIITALTMCLSLLPVQVFAEQDDGADHDNYVVKVNGTAVKEYVDGQTSDDAHVVYQVDKDGNMLLALFNLSLEADNDSIEGIGNAALYVKGANKLTVSFVGNNTIYEKTEPNSDSVSAAIYLDGFTAVEFLSYSEDASLTATAAGRSNTHSYGLYCRAPGDETMTVNIYSLGAVTFRSSPVDETAGEGQYHAGAFLTNANGQSGALAMKLGSLSLYGGTVAANVTPALSQDAEGMLLNLDSPNGRTLTATAVDDSLPIYVGGTRVTNTNAGNVLGDGHVSYNDQTCTLTLNNARIDTAYARKGSDMPVAYGVYFNDYLRTTDIKERRTLTIKLEGNNQIIVPQITESQAFYGYGISAYGGIRIVGSGSLTVAPVASAKMYSFTGIDAEFGSLIVGNEGSEPSVSIDLKDTTIAQATDFDSSRWLTFQAIEASGNVILKSGSVEIDFKGLTVSHGADAPSVNTITITGMECGSVSVDADAELSVSMWDETKGLVRSSVNLKDVDIKGLDVSNWDDKNPAVNLLGATNILLGGVSLDGGAKAENQRIIGIDASTAICCGEQVDIRVNAEKSEVEGAYVDAAVSTADTITRASEDVFVALLTGTPGEPGIRGVSLANFKPRVDSISNYLVIYAQNVANLHKEPAPGSVVFTATGLNKGELSNIGEGDLYYSVDGGRTWQLVTMKQSADSFEVTGVNAADDLKLYRGGNYYTTLDSDIVSIDDVTQADKPVIGTVTQPTAESVTGTVAGVTAAMEYSHDGGMTWTECGGDNIVLPVGLYQFRVKAAGHMLASSSASVEIVAYGASPAATPEAVFDADGMDSGVLSNVASGMSYSLDGGETWTAITGTSVNIERGVSADMDILVRDNGDGRTTSASKTQTIDVVAQAAPSSSDVIGVNPTVLANNNGSITGVTTDMQIWWDDAWKDCEGTEVTGLWPDVYSLRYKPDGTKLASDVLTIELDYFEGTQAETPNVTFVADGSDSGYLCGVTTRMTYSVRWGEDIDITDVDSDGRYHVTEMLKVYRVERNGALTLMDNIKVSSGKLSWSTGSHSLYMVAQEYTVTFDAATNGGACATASAVTTNDRLTSLPSASKASDASYNYSFTGWFTAPVGGEAVTASTNYTADTTIYAQFASSTRGSSTSRSSSASTSTASVSGSTVTPKTSISGTTATVGTISDADLNKAGASGVSSGTVVIDVRDGRKTVDEARLSSGLLSRIEKLTTADGLTLGLSTGDVSFNDDALSAIAAAGSGTVSVSLKTGDTKLLTSAQVRSVSNLDVVTILSVNLTVGGKAVTSFGDGEVTIAIPFTPRAGTDIGDYRVAYIDDEGRWSVIDSSGANGRLSFRTNHFSDYVVLYRPAESVDNPFFDVPTDAWYYDTVLYAYRNGLMNGVSNHMFNPESIMTRGMLATILWRMDGSPDAAYTALFSDVSDGAWYIKAILWAASNGIVMGDNGKFAPDDAVTREQFAAMLYRYATYKGMDISVGEDTNILSYGDASSVSEYAISAMQWVCGAGIVNGYTEHGEQVLDPQRASTRAVAATMLMRFCTGNR